MFLELDKIDRERIAAIDDSNTELKYGEISDFVKVFGKVVSERAIIFCLCENSIGSLAGYLGCLNNNLVPLLIGKSIDKQLLNELFQIYLPMYIWTPKSFAENFNVPVIFEKYGYVLMKTNNIKYPINDKLSLLLTTSGSTGSPKLVRYKYGNLESNARNVAKGFEWTDSERPIIDLPMQYTMGLNVINSHLHVGATLILTNYNIMSREFWTVLKEKKVTNFTGVPFSYELFSKLHFERMELPHLKTLAQGGGKLSDELFKKFAEYAVNNDKRFFATFGTTETSARMSYLPPELAVEKCGSIGRAFPEGEMFLIDKDGKKIAGDNIEGELAFRGPNVTMGYARCKEDLLLGDIWNGEYHTGDIARRDEDGCYYIVGRLSRFLKLSGFRISLDQCENLLKSEFKTECACTGTDSKMKVFITKKGAEEEILRFISGKTGIYKSYFYVSYIEVLPKNDFGKIRYSELNKL